MAFFSLGRSPMTERNLKHVSHEVTAEDSTDDSPPLSSPPRLSTVCLDQIVGLPSHAAVWHRSRDSIWGRAFRPSGNRRAWGFRKKVTRLERTCNLRLAPSAHVRQ